MIVYKVVGKRDGGYFSAEISDFQLEYFKDRIITPEIPNSFIFVFKEISRVTEAYQSHVFRSKYYEVWECETQSAPRPIYQVASLVLYKDEIIKYWAKIQRDLMTEYPTPFGTYGVRDLQFIKVVDSPVENQ